MYKLLSLQEHTQKDTYIRVAICWANVYNLVHNTLLIESLADNTYHYVSMEVFSDIDIYPVMDDPHDLQSSLVSTLGSCRFLDL